MGLAALEDWQLNIVLHKAVNIAGRMLLILFTSYSSNR